MLERAFSSSSRAISPDVSTPICSLRPAVAACPANICPTITWVDATARAEAFVLEAIAGRFGQRARMSEAPLSGCGRQIADASPRQALHCGISATEHRGTPSLQRRIEPDCFNVVIN
jgi:hypothetical protein